MKRMITIFSLLLITFSAVSAVAAQVRVFVGDVNVIGVQNRDEMKATVQALLASRLSNDKLLAVGSAAEADAIITGTYIVIGKIFSLDGLVKTTSGKTITRSFVQGDSQDELVAAITKLADKLSIEVPQLIATVPVAVSKPSTKSDFIKNEAQVSKTASSDFIKPAEFEHGSSSGWVSKRLEGAANLMAVGKELPDGSREFFLAGDRRIAYYRKGKEMRLIDTTENFRATEKIISLDTCDLPGNAVEIYVTVLRGDELASQVWQVQGDKLVKVADALQYLFRSFGLAGGQKKLYAQEFGPDGDYFGDVSEAVRTGSSIQLKNPIKMPRYGNIYTFNQFRYKDGMLYTVVINPDNYLIVYDKDLREIWRSNDKFGGSELFFLKEDLSLVRSTGQKFRWIFMNQRIQVTAQGKVIVGKNDGFWVLGNARLYKKGIVYCMAWNESSLEEVWRTKDTQNYMPDYYYDESRNELIMLQTVQRPGLTERGASSLSIKQVD